MKRSHLFSFIVIFVFAHSSLAMSQSIAKEAVGESDIVPYCLIFSRVAKLRDFQTKVIQQMIEVGKMGAIDDYWLKPACEADYMSQAKSPLIHIAADNPAARIKYVVRLKELYEEKNDLETFKRIANSKNTKGQSLLDYIQTIYDRNLYTKAEEYSLNEMVGLLCKSGAEYSQIKKTCPVEYLRIP